MEIFNEKDCSLLSKSQNDMLKIIEELKEENETLREQIDSLYRQLNNIQDMIMKGD